MKIYLADISALSPYLSGALSLLPPERQARIRAQKDAAQALQLLGGGLLLRRFVGEGPFLYGAHGKPAVAEGKRFNLSHGGALAALALDENEVGLDLERADRPWKREAAERLLLAEERRWLAAQPEAAFLYLWTRKEAVVKCGGWGLSRLREPFSVLPGALCRLDGRTYHLATECYHDHILSAASAAGPVTMELIPVGPEDLL